MSQRQTHGGFGHQQYHSSRVPREIQEVEGGHYDSHGFYNLPGGDFYDPDGYYFNIHGFDDFGGFYDDQGFYHPGEGNKHEFQEYFEDEEDELIRQYERGHAEEEDYELDPSHNTIYREFVEKKVYELMADEDLDESPQKYRETEEEKQEKLMARGSKETEKKLEDAKEQIHHHQYHVEEQKTTATKNAKRGKGRGKPVDQDLQFSEMDHLKQKEEKLGTKAKIENYEAKIEHHVPIGGSPHRESDLKQQPVKELANIPKPKIDVIDPVIAKQLPQVKVKQAQSAPKQTTKPAPKQATKPAQPVKNIQRSGNEDWSSANFF